MDFWKTIRGGAFLPFDGIVPCTVHVKLEGLNLGGSIKIKTALGLIEEAEQSGMIKPDTIIIESSSGNLGVALAMVCADRGYPFECVVDPNASRTNIEIMKALGATVFVVQERDENGGFLASRIRFIKRKMKEDRRYFWTNQYQNAANPLIHERSTATEIAQAFPRLDYLFVGAGTTGTLMGCAGYFRKHQPDTKIVAVDSVGSVTFGGPPGPRHISGLGTSRVPEICDRSLVHDVVMIPEAKTVELCRRIARRHGVLFGGSTGTVLAAVEHYTSRLPADASVVVVSPDNGEKYLDTIYSDEWVRDRFPGLLGHRAVRDMSLAPAELERTAAGPEATGANASSESIQV
ncbi:2,3-diaminopropionate biosynthesis protein SbnA [Bradyrhizobium sp. 170]|nr:2,3-diaminopropionate biosynthesis protein SbnA [Bradyrhizobium sp. 170]